MKRFFLQLPILALLVPAALPAQTRSQIENLSQSIEENLTGKVEITMPAESFVSVFAE